VSKIGTIATLVTYGAMTLRAGNISGKVTGGKGHSVVWVEAIAGKNFPKPDKPITIDQKQLLFQPHIMVAPMGTTVEFRTATTCSTMSSGHRSAETRS
jgi:hypothetical protein